MQIIFRHAWVLFILFTCVNGAVWWQRAQAHIHKNAELRPGYIKLIRGWLLFGNLPWIVMGLGILFGDVPSVMHYFNPRNGAMVVVWYATVVALWIASVYWLFFRHGAETLIAYPGLLNFPAGKPGIVKLYFLLCLAGGIAGLLGMIFSDIPVPQ
jgi:hypothetical protein